MLSRLFPRRVDNRFVGHRAALWLLGLYVALKLVMSVNAIFNTRMVAAGDGLALDRFGAEAGRTVLMLFALMALGQLMIALLALAALIRWRALVPFAYLLLIAEHGLRRIIVGGHAVAGAEATTAAIALNYGLLALLAAGLLLSLLGAGRGEVA
jgi:hypothetical protein